MRFTEFRRGCEFNNKKRWCMPWGACVYFEDKNAAQNNIENTELLQKGKTHETIDSFRNRIFASGISISSNVYGCQSGLDWRLDCWLRYKFGLVY